ncbi:MAG: hypothetical protein MUC96_15120 [Myxococcaceae bacterium]|jgi:hypothetical protein|nr:hypothetical protein [Myxococcaceae bacterium]
MSVDATPTRTAVLLGAQRFQPTLAAAVRETGVKGRIALVTAGWQEREDEDEELVQHLDGNTINLMLYKRGEQLFREDREFALAHKERQNLLRSLQDVYRLRLERALDAEAVVRLSKQPESIRHEVEQACIDAIRDLDAWHLYQCAKVRAEFNEKWKPLQRPAIARHRGDLIESLSDCGAIAIAGGHVAVLVNRLLLFGLESLIGARTVFAWSAGAMAVSQRVVLFHDDPPQGQGASEVLDAGLGLVPNVVVFPEPETRLKLDDGVHVGLIARRFAPSRCIALPARASVVLHDGKVVRTSGAVHLNHAGDSLPS